MHSQTKWRIASIILVLQWVVAAIVSAAPIADPIKVDGGQISGAKAGEDTSLLVYKGVPFAAPPVGELRWKAPAPVKPWEGVKACTAYSAGCAQPRPMIPLPGLNPPLASEDCLYLNVWTPAKDTADKVPVMFWIHGGGFTMGTGGTEMYDGAKLASKGVVVVTINYRLGPFGFLAHPALTKESPNKSSGNYGLLDQIEALKWVQRNIASFGGDPGRVTIYGESAGAVSVSMLMVSPLSKNLFHGAIAQSGSVSILPTRHLNKSRWGISSMEQQGIELAKALGCDTATDPLAAMRAKTVEEIFAAQPKGSFAMTNIYSNEAFPWWVITDGWVIPEDPETMFIEGKAHNVPFMIGTNADEGSMFAMMTPIKDPAGYEATARGTFKEHADKVLAAYPASSPEQVKSTMNEFLTDALFIRGARCMAVCAANAKRKVYYYHFTKTHKTGFGSNLGAHHAAELPYVFGGLEAMKVVDPSDKSLSDKMIDYWTNFAKKGDPNGGDLPKWSAYDAVADHYLELGEKIETKLGLRRAKIDILDAIMNAWRSKMDAPLGG